MVMVVLKEGVKEIHQFITEDGDGGFKAVKGRYHLYLALACPFCHRLDIHFIVCFKIEYILIWSLF